MITDLLKSISYVCPACFEFHRGKVNLFTAGNREHEVVSCDLRESGVLLKKERDLMLAVPCFACGSFHVFPVALRRLNRGKLMTFTCPNSGMDIMVLGNDADVVKWEKDYECVLESLLEAQEEYNNLINEIVNKIQMSCLEGHIKCECGKCAPKLYVDDRTITVKCKNCDSTLVLQTATEDDVQNILNMDCLVLQRPGGKKKPWLHLVRKD